MGAEPDFTIVLRGYDKDEVDAYVARVAVGGAPADGPRFTVRLRGYARHEVDAYVSDHTAAERQDWLAQVLL